MTMLGQKEKLSLLDFNLQIPQELIAQQALAERDGARLLIHHSGQRPINCKIRDLTNLLTQDTLLIMNNTEVFASRLMGKLADGHPAEVFLLEKPCLINNRLIAPCLVRPSKKIHDLSLISFPDGMNGQIYKNSDSSPPAYSVEFLKQDENTISTWLKTHAYVPLPPYIRREHKLPWNSSEDRDRYQTVYASQGGSVAAPTAGLHFSHTLLECLRQSGVKIATVTLHVGGGTFLPVRTNYLSQHKMHKEKYYVPSKTWEAIINAKKLSHKIVAVGTTSFRCIESFIAHETTESKTDKWLETDLFIYPQHKEDKYHSPIFDGILTNFHQPNSTLFMLICALIGFNEAHTLYKEAISQKYRFFSYGDSSLLWF